MIAASETGAELRLLLLDTCGDEASLALARSDVIVGSVQIGGRASSERVLPELRSLLDHLGWSLSELGAVSVVHGPGSFTGVRVGVSTAKALAEATGMPLLVLSRLEVLARLSAKLVHGACVVALSAGRNEVFFSRCTRGQGERAEVGFA